MEPFPATEEAGNPAGWNLPRDVAIPRLVGQYGGSLFALGSRLCGEPEEAEDLVQETFLQAHRCWDQFSGRGEPAAWLYRIAARICSRLHQRRAGEPDHMLSLEDLLPFGQTRFAVVPSAEEDALSEQVRLEGISRLETAIAALPARFRMPLVLKDIVGFTVPAVASILDIKEGTAKSRIHRARLKLRMSLEAILPRRPMPPSPYSEQVCLDLLHAKQDSLDRGVEMPQASELICERCEAMFATLDLTQELCQRIEQPELPRTFRAVLMAKVST